MSAGPCCSPGTPGPAAPGPATAGAAGQGTGTPAAGPVPRDRLVRRARRLAAASVLYNVAEAVVAVGAGAVAGSVALVGFGLDSLVEVSSGLIVLWQFARPLPERHERAALRGMAVSFWALAACTGVGALRALAGGHEAAPSPVGVGLAVTSLLVMPGLSWAQRRTGRALGSGTVVADSTQTLLCTWLSAVLLVGLLVDAALGWWWADPLAALAIAAVAAREGLQAWRGEACTCTPAPPADAAAAPPGRTPGAGDGCCGAGG